jgi:hypothetical protein
MPERAVWESKKEEKILEKGRGEEGKKEEKETKGVNPRNVSS